MAAPCGSWGAGCSPRGAGCPRCGSPVPAVAPAPTRGRPCISGAGSRCPSLFSGRALRPSFQPIKRFIGHVLYENLSSKANSFGGCGTSSLFQQLGPMLLWFRASDVCVARRGCALACPAPDGCPFRWEVGAGTLVGASSERLQACERGRHCRLPDGGGWLGHHRCCCSEGSSPPTSHRCAPVTSPHPA